MMILIRICGQRETGKCPLSGAKSAPGITVTIYSGTDCKLCDMVREGEMLGR